MGPQSSGKSGLGGVSGILGKMSDAPPVLLATFLGKPVAVPKELCTEH